MKYVIWGCGVLGKRLLYWLGQTWKVAAIVESNEELHGSTHRGIPIISFDEYLLSYSEYPVIVTPANSADEIIDQLKLKHILGAFSFPRERAQLESFLVQLPIEQTLNRYDDSDGLAIYGVSALGLLLYDLLSENRFEVSLVLPSNTSSSLEKYVKETLKLKTVSAEDVKRNSMRLLLTVELEENDQDKLYGVTYEKYYDLHLHEELFYKPELEKFKNIHRGKRCFIVATGPSLRIDDLNTLYHNGEICISVNSIFKAFDKTKWRPDYYVVSDPGVAQWKNEILEMDAQTKFVADVIDCFDDKPYDNIFKWHFIREETDQEIPYFSDDFARGGFVGYTVVYDGAMQLAAYMGFQEIYLLGTDCTVYPDGRVPHFGTDDSELGGGYWWMKLWPSRIMRSYQVAKQYADSHGIKIYNATRGGALEVFPRVDFDSLFN